MRVAITGYEASVSSDFQGDQSYFLRPTSDFRAWCGGRQDLEADEALQFASQCQGFFSSDDFGWRDEISVVFGSSKGVVSQLENPPSPIFSHASWAPDLLASHLAQKFKTNGRVLAPNSACATGSHALALGAQLIQDGYAKFVIAGAMEYAHSPVVLAAYKNMGALSKSRKMRPFDANRDGFLPACGGGFLILESEEHAQNRGAKIHGFLTGYSMKCDATSLTSMSPSGDSIARAIDDAMRRAGFPTLDYINAHGTGTKQNDAIEARGIELALGAKIPVSSTKPLTGHLLGAAGAVEAIVCLLAMKNQFLPPTVGLENVDEEMNLDFVRGQGRKAKVSACLSLNYGFGGHIGAIIFESNEF